MQGEAPLASRILVVDDEQANLKLLDRMLRGQGYRNIDLVSDPRQAIDTYLSGRPDIILLDINMPYLDGYAVLEKLKQLNDPLLPPVVILTAQHGKDFLLRALAAGARDFLTKPFDHNELSMRVRNMLDAHLAHRFMHDRKAVLEELVRQRTEELRQTRLQVVQRLGMAAEYRDEETGNHILRMSHTSALLARHLGWSQDTVELLLHAAPMHDIGKIAIPDNVLLKPGKLLPEEWEIMKSHTSVGAKLLDGDDSELLTMARDIALRHHEKWDGSGYPGGLAGSSIPEAARIAGLADVFDALMSDRPYKKAWTTEAAVEYIRGASGTHFDPRIVEVFMGCLPEVAAIRTRFSEAAQTGFGTIRGA